MLGISLCKTFTHYASNHTYISVDTSPKAEMVEISKKQFNRFLRNAASSQTRSEVLAYLYEGHNFSLYKVSWFFFFFAVENKVEFKSPHAVSGGKW